MGPIARHAAAAVLACAGLLALGGCDPAGNGAAVDGAATTAASTAAPSAPVPSPTPVPPAPTAPDPGLSPTPEPSPEPTPPPPAIDRVAWADDLEGGRSLQVFPTQWGRDPRAADQGWAEVVALEPEAGTAIMERQFRCHVLGAPDKESWNLEPWRPDVPYADVLLARCNPS